MSSPRSGLVPGAVVAGKFRIERVLGAGGMGVVVAAHHIPLDQKVALKFLLPASLESTELRARFHQEARAAVRIKNDHVARVIDVGELEDGSPYIVMEFLEGIDLATWLKTKGPLSIAQATDFALQTCEALAEAHTSGIVHRDLKPANLFCTERSDGSLCIKVLDFGISKVTAQAGLAQNLTTSAALVGSPYYMSPEQMALAKSVDVRSDIWSLGVILFELLTGRWPFQAKAVTELAIKVATEPAPLLRAFRFDAPDGLEAVIARCLEKDRERRYANVGELSLALRDYATGDGQSSATRVLGTLRRSGVGEASNAFSPGEGASGDPPGAVAASTIQDSRKPRPRGWVAMLLAALVFGIVTLLVVLLRGSSVSPATQPSVTPLAAAPPSSSATPGAASGETRSPDAAASPPPSASAIPAVTPPPNGPRRERVPPTTTGAPARVPAKNCDPPYVLDRDGVRQYKPECL